LWFSIKNFESTFVSVCIHIMLLNFNHPIIDLSRKVAQISNRIKRKHHIFSISLFDVLFNDALLTEMTIELNNLPHLNRNI
jgi:hypothetical protein